MRVRDESGGTTLAVFGTMADSVAEGQVLQLNKVKVRLFTDPVTNVTDKRLSTTANSSYDVSTAINLIIICDKMFTPKNNPSNNIFFHSFPDYT